MKGVHEYLRQFCGINYIRIKDIVRPKLIPEDECNYPFTNFSRTPILDPETTGNPEDLKSAGPFSYSYMIDRVTE